MTKQLPKGNAVFLDLDTTDRGDLDLSPLRGACPDWRLFRSTDRAQVGGRIAEATLVACNKVPLSREDLASATRLRLVCVAATGTNNVDLAAAREFGIAVTNVTGYATASVVQHVFTLALALTTRLAEYHRAISLNCPWRRMRAT
jgi:glycerate dehydrogenase